MNAELDDRPIDLLEGYEDDEYPRVMDVFDDWRAFTEMYGRDVAEAALDAAQIAWPPPTIALDMSTKCNLRCPICPSNGDAQAREIYTRKQYDWRVLADFIVDNGGANTLTIGSLGEPFLKEDTFLFLDAVKDHVRDFAFSTNGTAISVENIQRLAEYPISSIRLSCDAGDPLSYPLWRKGASYEVFSTNAREFGRLFGKRVGIHAVFFKENLESLKTIPEFTHDLNISIVEVCSLKLRGATARNGLHCTTLKETCDLFNLIMPKGEELGVEIIPAVHFQDAEMAKRAWELTSGRIGSADFVNQYSRAPCHEPWRMINIANHGELSPCCGGPEGALIHGNPFEQPAEALVNNRSLVLLRAMLIAGFTPSMCQFFCRKCFR